MFKLKPLSAEGVPAAIERAERYRLLNEPKLSHSICLDVLEVEPENQKALVVLLLSLTDQFSGNNSALARQARQLVPRLKGEYEQEYYSGIVSERMGIATLELNLPGCKYDAYEWLQEAMASYERAEKLHPAGNDEAILRWNTCARIIMDRDLEKRADDDFVPLLE